jgi:hypothetical protein
MEKVHQEIANSMDKNPADLSCEDRAKLPGGGQIIPTNHMAASIMLIKLYTVLEEATKGKEAIVKRVAPQAEVFFDVKTYGMLSHSRVARISKKLVTR